MRACVLLLLLQLLSVATPSIVPCTAAQEPQPATRPNALPDVRPLLTIGSAWEDRTRVAQLLGLEGSAGFLIRSASSLTPAYRAGTAPFEFLAVEFRAIANSAIPYSLNEGPLWAGRGISYQALAGLRTGTGPVTLTLAPQISYAQNRHFEVLPWPLYFGRPGRHRFGSFWYSEGGNVDLPYRFGSGTVIEVHPGQSTLALATGPAVLGLSTENQWWGPGVRNAIVMSNNAAGFPHLFVRTAAPVETGIGRLEGRWVLGELRESAFFDTIPGNDLRSLSGVVVTYSPRGEPRLTLGVARTVYGPVGGRGEALGHAFRVFRSWERRPSAAEVDWEPAVDQLLSFFGRWIFPAEGMEVYAEWSRHELPVSIRDFLLAPHHTQGYTIGAQWARPLPTGVLRLQSEITQLEQSATFKQRPSDPFYTSRGSEQGYTHRGQILGAAIGPGSSAQWLALDHLGERMRLGGFAARIRWENDALYTSPSPDPARGHRSAHAHDVSVIGGLRAGYAVRAGEIGAEISLAKRYNYHFQNPDQGFGPDGAVDVWNRTFRLEFTPTRRASLVRGRQTQ